MAPPDNALGTKVKRARERKRWTQQELADRLEVSRKSVDNWENGRTSPTSSLGALEAILGVNLTSGSHVTSYTEPDEVAIWRLETFSDDEKHELIRHLRRMRK